MQYVLGSQPFGSLDIKCKSGVLIPRPETEAYVCHLVDLLKSGALLGQRPASYDALRVIDFCTGTGCIPLLLFSSLQRSVQSLDVRGIDISPVALRLARANVEHNVGQGYMSPPNERLQVSFAKGDVFSDSDIQAIGASTWDVMVSNPPYVAKDVWDHGRGQLGYSVRKYEPRLALVPGGHLPSAPKGLHPEDVFYARLLDVASILRPKALLLEIGDREQAYRVVTHCATHKSCVGCEVQVWRDWPDLEPESGEDICFRIRPGKSWEQDVPIRGSGNIRSILIRRI